MPRFPYPKQPSLVWQGGWRSCVLPWQCPHSSALQTQMCTGQDAALFPARLAVTQRMPQGSKPDEEDAVFLLFGNEAAF